MARTRRKIKPPATIWEVNDELWATFRSILDELDPPPKAIGRPRADPRRILNGIIYVMRSGCQWNRLPEKYGSDSTVHRTMQRRIQRGVLQRFWAVLIENCKELGGVDWQWQSADAAMGKARFGGIMSAPTPRIAGKTAPNAA
jgi:putative transposase